MWIEAFVMLAFFVLTNSFLVWCAVELYGMYLGEKRLRRLHDERARLDQMAFDLQVKAFNERMEDGEL